MKSLFSFSLVFISFGLYCQSTFYTFRPDVQLKWNDTLTISTLVFKIPVSDFEAFEELWIDHLEDVADGDVADDDHYIVAEEVEVPSLGNALFNAYSRVLDLHDSLEIKVAFQDSSGFLSRSNFEQMAVLEASAKRFLTNAFVEYKNDELEEREEELDDARDEVEEKQDDIANINRSIQRKGQRIQERKTEIAEARQALNVIGEQIGQQRQTLARLPVNAEDEREDIEDAIKGLERRHERTEKDIRDWDEDIFDTEDDIRKLRMELSETELELEQARGTLNSKRARFEELRLEIAGYLLE